MQAAIDGSTRALSFSQETGDRRDKGNHLGNLGLAFSQLGEAGKAIHCYERALVIAQEIGDRRLHGNQPAHLGLAYSDLGREEEAVAHWRAALEIYEAIRDPNAARVWGWLREVEQGERGA